MTNIQPVTAEAFDASKVNIDGGSNDDDDDDDDDESTSVEKNPSLLKTITSNQLIINY